MGVALCMVRDDHELGAPAQRITVRILSVSPLTSLRDLKSATVGKFVSVRGNIIRVSAVRPLVLRMNFLCLKCGSEVVTRFEDGKFEPPQSCGDPGCRSRNFKPDYASARAVDWQKCRLQVRVCALVRDGRLGGLWWWGAVWACPCVCMSQGLARAACYCYGLDHILEGVSTSFREQPR
jgi:DNA replicative helicase MCM subunit Mcm2 (Cdc46/Mcm family)